MVDGPGPGGRAKRVLARVERFLPAARVLWIGVAVLGTYGVLFLGGGLGLAGLIGFPSVAVLVDLAFQRARFEDRRFPDAALGTGLLLAVLLPPEVPWVAGAAAVLVAIALRHVVRIRGRPVLNPAASGVVVGALLFGTSPAWWGSINESLVLVVGIALALRNRAHWRLPATFLLVFAVLSVLQHAASAALTGATEPASVLLLSTVDPSMIFFGLFLVPEPRTAPSGRAGEPIYAVAIAAASVLATPVLPTLAPLAALLGTNVGLGFLRLRRGRAIAADRARESSPSPPRRAPPWPIPSRVGALILVGILLALLTPFAAPPGTPHPPLLVTSGPPTGPVSSGRSAALCRADNPAIPSATLSDLHRILGPSVILSDDSSTGVVSFYDPVNNVTVTETDLYEDFGYAEFNSDDLAVGGCSP